MMKMKSPCGKISVSCLIMSLLLLGLSAGPLRAETAELENHYLEVLSQGTTSARTVVAKKITQGYIRNPEIFKFIKQTLLTECGRASGQEFLDMLAWYCKALASSGQEKYRSVLNQVEGCSSDPKLQMHARKSIDSLAFHAHRNHILARTDDFIAQGFDNQSARLAVMLEADDWHLKRDAAKTISRATLPDKRLFPLVSEQLLAGLDHHSGDYNTYIDGMAWLCKALAASGDRQYLATLDRVVSTTDSEKLKRYAGQAGGTFAH